jgi:hypothetical protein
LEGGDFLDLSFKDVFPLSNMRELPFHLEAV